MESGIVRLRHRCLRKKVASDVPNATFIKEAGRRRKSLAAVRLQAETDAASYSLLRRRLLKSALAARGPDGFSPPAVK
jgi:hypothetical protein